MSKKTESQKSNDKKLKQTATKRKRVESEQLNPYEPSSHSKLENFYRCYLYLQLVDNEELQCLRPGMNMYKEVFFGEAAPGIQVPRDLADYRSLLLELTLKRFPVFELFDQSNRDMSIYKFEASATTGENLEKAENLDVEIDDRQPVPKRRKKTPDHYGYTYVEKLEFDADTLLEVLEHLQEKIPKALGLMYAEVDEESEKTEDRDVVEKYKEYMGRYSELLKIYEHLLIMYFETNYCPDFGDNNRPMPYNAHSYEAMSKYKSVMRKWLEMFSSSIVIRENMFEIIFYILSYVSVEIWNNCDQLANQVTETYRNWYGFAQSKNMVSMDVIYKAFLSLIRAECPFIQQVDQIVFDKQKMNPPDYASLAIMYMYGMDKHTRLFSAYKRISERDKASATEKGSRKRKRGSNRNTKAATFQHQNLLGNKLGVVQVTNRSVHVVY